jgi:hypothetical protein
MSRRNSLEAKRARRERKQEIVSARLRKQRKVMEEAESFVTERIKEAKERARAHLESLDAAGVRAEYEAARERNSDLPPKSQVRSKRAMIDALVPPEDEDLRDIFASEDEVLAAARLMNVSEDEVRSAIENVARS